MAQRLSLAQLDVVAVGVENEGAVVARVVDGALAGGAVVLVARGERGGVEGPHRGVLVRGEREVDVLSKRALVAHKRANQGPENCTRSGASCARRSPACGATTVV